MARKRSPGLGPAERLVKPASIGMTAPVRDLAPLELSHTAAAATSSASTSDPSGWCWIERAS